jgi:hypothetical protein
MDGVNHYVCPFVEACERVKLGLQSAKRKRAKKRKEKKRKANHTMSQFSVVYTRV